MDVLIFTGGLLASKEESIPRLLRKQLLQWNHSESAWLELKIKAAMAEPLLTGEMEKQKWLKKSAHRDRELTEFLTSESNSNSPSLTEVSLMTLANRNGLSFEALTFDDLFRRPRFTGRLLRTAKCVLLSSTFLRDEAELQMVINMIRRPGVRVIVGGALAGSLHSRWKGMDGIDLLTVGYGELLMPALADWIRSGFSELKAPQGGRLLGEGTRRILYSGVPQTLSLDFLPTPDWAVAETYHKRKFSNYYYESVRGCPYRCSFCNYPYLFEDNKFRTRSAKQMADDWEYYVKTLGVKYITCLDSLFTMPRARLIEFCELLIERNIRVKWICYARADDLVDESVVALMVKAGAHQVQIGIESGDQGQLDRMNKRTSLSSNAQALVNCRKHGLTTVVSVIVGYPGETVESVMATYEFLRTYPPDFYFIATFSVRVTDVPVLQSPLKDQFGLKVMDNRFTVSPYWTHSSMSCTEVGRHVRWLGDQLILNRVALDATVHFSSLLEYRPRFREILLDLQQNSLSRHPWVRHAFNLFNGWIDRRLELDFSRKFTSHSEA